MPVNLAGSMPHCSLGLAGYRIQAQRELPVAFEHAVLAALIVRDVRRGLPELFRDPLEPDVPGSMMWSSTLNRLNMEHPPPSLGAIS
jgi:hypothetical protein